MKNQLLSIEDIKNDEFKKLVVMHNDAITKFLKVVSNGFSSATGNAAVIPTAVEDHMKMCILEEDSENWLDDGNTRTPGKSYNVLWVLPLNGKELKELTLHDFEYNLPEAIMFTMDNFEERLKDGRIGGCKFFNLYLSYGNYLQFKGWTNEVRKDRFRIDYQNDNYQYLSILNSGNVVRLIGAINEMSNMIRIADTVFGSEQSIEKVLRDGK